VKANDKIQRTLMSAMLLVVVAAPCQLAVGQESSVPKDSLSPHIKLRSVSLKDVRWTGGFWEGRYEQCRRVVTPNLWRVMQLPDNAATFNDLKIAGGLAAMADPGVT